LRSFSGSTGDMVFSDDVLYCNHGSVFGTVVNYPCPSAAYSALPVTGTYTLFLTPAFWDTGQVNVRLFGFSSDATILTTAGTATSPAIPVSLSTPGQNARLTFPVDITQQKRVSFSFSNLSLSSFTGDFTPSINFMVLDNTGNVIGGSGGIGQMFSYN